MSDERRAKQAARNREEAIPPSVRRFVLILRNNWKKIFWPLGISSLSDILKDFVLGKLMEGILPHLGGMGRWLAAYPFAFFTLTLSVVLAAVVVATIRESSITESSVICDEHGIPYERDPAISPNWTLGLAVVVVICICIISYGTYRYYQISVGHFKVDGGYNIVLPVPPGTPVPAPAKPPSSLLDVFDDDFPTLFKARNDLSIEGTNTRLKQQVYLDFLGKADFVGFYIPASSNPISNNTPKVCAMLVDQVSTALRELSKDNSMWAGLGSQGNTLNELTFTGRVLIYHEDSLSITQEAEIINAYKLKNLDVQFRSGDYLMGQIAMWHRQHP